MQRVSGRLLLNGQIRKINRCTSCFSVDLQINQTGSFNRGESNGLFRKTWFYESVRNYSSKNFLSDLSDDDDLLGSDMDMDLDSNQSSDSDSLNDFDSDVSGEEDSDLLSDNEDLFKDLDSDEYSENEGSDYDSDLFENLGDESSKDSRKKQKKIFTDLDSDDYDDSLNTSKNNYQNNDGFDSNVDDDEVKSSIPNVNIKPSNFPKGSVTAETWSFIEDYRNNGEIPPISLYYKILESYTHKNWIKRSLLVLNQMKELGPDPDVYCYNILLEYYLNNDDINSFESILTEMDERDIDFDKKTYENLFTLAEKSGDYDLLKGLLQEIKTEKFNINRNMYQCAISVFSQTGNIKHAFHFIKEQAEKRKLYPNIGTCNTLLESFVNNNLEKAKVIFDLMKKFKLSANEKTYELTMTGYINRELYEEVDRLYWEMKQDFQNIPQSTYAILMKNYFKKKDVARALEIFERVSEHEDVLIREIYMVGLEGFCENDDTENAKTMFLKLIEDGNISLDIEMVEILLEGYMRNQCFNDAQMLLEISGSQNVELRTSTYQILIEYSMKHELYDQALLWMKQLRQIQPNYCPTKEFFDDFIKGNLEQQGITLTVEDIMKSLNLQTIPQSSAEIDEENSKVVIKELKDLAISHKIMKGTRFYLPHPIITKQLKKTPISNCKPAKRISKLLKE